MRGQWENELFIFKLKYSFMFWNILIFINGKCVRNIIRCHPFILENRNILYKFFSSRHLLLLNGEKFNTSLSRLTETFNSFLSISSHRLLFCEFGFTPNDLILELRFKGFNFKAQLCHLFTVYLESGFSFAKWSYLPLFYLL